MNSYPDIPETLMAQFNEFIADHVGLHFPRERWRDLLRGISSSARDSGASNARTYIERLMSSTLSRREIEMLVCHLTVGETYFFRDEKTFAALEEHIFPALLRQRRNGGKYLRIWSAGCCTGEEPYSIMILLSRLLPDLDDWRITLLATDINARFLDRAREGIYGEWSFRATPLHIRQQYFTRTAQGRFQFKRRLRNRVTFSYLNLAEDAYPSLLNNTNAMDMIFCRNVLMYFSSRTAEKVVCKFHRCLVDDGLLVVSPVETPLNVPCAFGREHYPGMVAYRKNGGGTPGAGTCMPFYRTEATATEFPSCTDTTVGGVLVEPLPGTDGTFPQSNASPDSVTAVSPGREAGRLSLLYQQGRYEEVAEELETALRQPGGVEDMMLLARALANLGRLGDAGIWCKKALAADKLNPAAHYLYAVVLQEQGQPAEAMASLKRALYLDQDFAMACFALGNLASRQGRLREAGRYFQRALKIMDGYPQDACIPEAEGMTVGRLREIMRLALDRGTAL